MADMLFMRSSAGSDINERAAAKAALEAAEEQLQSLCASHAGTFVAVERRGRALEMALGELLEKVQAVESQVASTQEALQQEEDGNDNTLAALSEKHRVRRRTLLQHSSLLELLELPSLMDACVRSNLYEEALSIAAFANTLERRHTEKNQVVMKVIAQVRSRQSDLRRYLLHSLKNQVTMPECLEIVTALRRLNSIDLERLQSERSDLERVHAAMELSLQVDFLESRDAWLDQPANITSAGFLSPIGSSSGGNNSAAKLHSTELLLDTIERYRTRMFEIATQFNAIFRAQQATSSNNHVSVSLLSMWTARRIHSFLKILSVELRVMENSASLRDALDASAFFSQSMGRLGSDFTSQLPPLFEEKLVAIVLGHWNEGTSQLVETLKISREVGVVAPLVSTAAIEQEPGNLEGSEGATSSVMMPPPRQLMALPPLGRVVNACLVGLNELRRCLLPGVFPKIRMALEKEFLLEIKNTLHAHERAVMTPGLRGEAVQLREVAKQMKDVTKTIIFPYLRGALELSLGNDAGAKEHFDKLRMVLYPPAPASPPPSVNDEKATTEKSATSESSHFTENIEEVAAPVATQSAGGDLTNEETNEGGWADEGFDDDIDVEQV
ncbi:Dor1-like family protein [Nitzschia inconspicua]|uniref:Conserved oligomeric Golgi complex subunit 8 n=1 Tax=Nitzschia inconspicua TaxID=303405 RepID=A0A9K3PC67_9STRA|nr:Dor1-like family protein [Nitzschia inconspicua]